MVNVNTSTTSSQLWEPIAGTPCQVSLPAVTTLSSVATSIAGLGTSYALNNGGWAQINTVQFQYKSNSSAGARIVNIAFVDGNSNIVWTAASQVTQNSSLTFIHTFGQGIQGLSATTGSVISNGLPAQMLVPPNSTLWIYDSTSTSSTDTIAQTVGSLVYVS